MIVYLSSSYGNRFHLRDVAATIRQLGHTVLCQWIDEPESADGTWLYVRGRRDGTITKVDEAMEATLAHIANRDILEVAHADMFVRFPAHDPAHKSSGGKFVEMGIALGMMLRGKRIHVAIVGTPESVFDYDGTVMRFADEKELFDWLEDEAALPTTAKTEVHQGGTV